MSFTFIAILSAIFAAIANLLARVLLKNLKSKEILAINFFSMAATLVLISPFFYKFNLNLSNFGLVILIAFIDTLANYFYFKTFEKTEASIATPILSLAPAFTFFFSWLFLENVVSLQTYILSGLIILLITFFSTDFKNLKQFSSSTLIPALTSAFLFGISAIPSKFILDSGAINAPTLYMFRAALIAIFALLFFGYSLKGITTVQYRVIFVRGLFVIVQWVLLYYSFSKGSAGVSLTLGNITPIFVFILSTIFLREKPTIKKIIASFLIIVFSLII